MKKIEKTTAKNGRVYYYSVDENGKKSRISEEKALEEMKAAEVEESAKIEVKSIFTAEEARLLDEIEKATADNIFFRHSDHQKAHQATLKSEIANDQLGIIAMQAYKNGDDKHFKLLYNEMNARIERAKKFAEENESNGEYVSGQVNYQPFGNHSIILEEEINQQKLSWLKLQVEESAEYEEVKVLETEFDEMTLQAIDDEFLDDFTVTIYKDYEKVEIEEPPIFESVSEAVKYARAEYKKNGNKKGYSVEVIELGTMKDTTVYAIEGGEEIIFEEIENAIKRQEKKAAEDESIEELKEKITELEMELQRLKRKLKAKGHGESATKILPLPKPLLSENELRKGLIAKIACTFVYANVNGLNKTRRTLLRLVFEMDKYNRKVGNLICDRTGIDYCCSNPKERLNEFTVGDYLKLTA